MPPASRPSSELEAIDWLVERVPELRPLMDEHVASYGEVIPYILFEVDFRRWFVDRVRARDHAPARRFMEALEPLLTPPSPTCSMDNVTNFIGVAFVEGLVMATKNRMDKIIETARPWMGPHTSREFDEMFGHRDRRPGAAA